MFENKNFEILNGEALETLKTLEDNSVNTIVTSPPYYALRDYGTATWVGGDPNCKHMKPISDSATTGTHAKMRELGITCASGIYKTVCPDCGAVRVDKQIGLEETPEEYIDKLVSVFRECRRVLKDDGTLWINIGDSYASNSHSNHNFDYDKGRGSNNDNIIKTSTISDDIKQKDLIGIPWMLAFALRKDGWYLRQDIIWAKPNPMPESVTDRCTKSHEYIFLLSKNTSYYFDNEAIREESNNLEVGVKNKRDVWRVPVSNSNISHFATYPEKLILPCVLAGSPEGGVVLDPFSGSGTTGMCALHNKRKYIGVELNEEYAKISETRLSEEFAKNELW